MADSMVERVRDVLGSTALPTAGGVTLYGGFPEEDVEVLARAAIAAIPGAITPKQMEAFYRAWVEPIDPADYTPRLTKGLAALFNAALEESDDPGRLLPKHGSGP